MAIFPAKPRSDSDLVAAAGRGDTSAFDELYFRYRQWVHRLAMRFTGNDADAWDVHQETFMYLAKKLPDLKLTATIKTLLFPVVRNLSIKANGKRRRLVAGEELLAALPARPTMQIGNEDLLTALRELDLAHRQVVLLRYIDDLSIEEAAEVLGIPAGTVKSRLFHAHKLMRQSPRLQRYFEA